MEVKTSELIGPALDWAVAQCEARSEQERRENENLPCLVSHFQPSTDWYQGGPIIEREKVSVDWSEGNDWCASCDANPRRVFSSSTPLIAAMRCYVASKLGDVVDVPEELAK